MRQATGIAAVCLLGSLPAVGCRTRPEAAVQYPPYTVETWGRATVQLERTESGELIAVWIEIRTLVEDCVPELYDAARQLARTPMLVSIEGRIDLSLPASEGFQGSGRTAEGGCFLAQGHDPAMSTIGDGLYRITLPLRSQEARESLVAGARVTINPYVNGFAEGGLQGLSFNW